MKVFRVPLYVVLSRYLFWVTSSGINRSRLDGSSAVLIFSRHNITDTTLNLADKRICFCDVNAVAVECVDYDGRQLVGFFDSCLYLFSFHFIKFPKTCAFVLLLNILNTVY